MNLETFEVRSVLGDARTARVNPGNGHPWINCPFCYSPIYLDEPIAGHAGLVGDHGVCRNGWCLANPAMSLDDARRARGAAMVEEMHEQARKRDHAAAMRRIAEDQRRNAAIAFFDRLKLRRQPSGSRRWYASPGHEPDDPMLAVWLPSGSTAIETADGPSSTDVWIITEADHSATTILLPEDY